jgi:ABC-type phosphate/phosphonate transport system permease subunit
VVRTSAASTPSFKDKTMYQILGLMCFAAWLTHIFTCFAQSLWGFLIAGALMFPIGILHGFYLWFK